MCFIVRYDEIAMFCVPLVLDALRSKIVCMYFVFEVIFCLFIKRTLGPPHTQRSVVRSYYWLSPVVPYRKGSELIDLFKTIYFVAFGMSLLATYFISLLC